MINIAPSSGRPQLEKGWRKDLGEVAIFPQWAEQTSSVTPRRKIVPSWSLCVCPVGAPQGQHSLGVGQGRVGS